MFQEQQHNAVNSNCPGQISIKHRSGQFTKYGIIDSGGSIYEIQCIGSGPIKNVIRREISAPKETLKLESNHLSLT